MKILDKIKKEYKGNEFITVPGLDDAVIGIQESTMRLVYSISKSIEILGDVKYSDIRDEETGDGQFIWVRNDLSEKEISDLTKKHNIK